MAGRQRLRAGPGSREGKHAHLVEGAAPASSLGAPATPPAGLGPAEPALLSQQGRGTAGKLFLSPAPFHLHLALLG